MKFLRIFSALIPCLLFLAIELGCGNTYRPVANPIVSHGGQPQNTYTAWVLNYNPVGAGSSTKIDVSGDTNLQVLSMGNGSVYESYQGGLKGSIFVANRDADSISQFSLIGTTSVINIALYPGSRPVALASTDATQMYVANSGQNAICPTTGSMSVIGTSSLVATNTLCVGSNPGPIVELPSAGKVYIANQGDSSVTVYNPTTLSISSTITQANGLHSNPVAMIVSSDGAYVFVVEQGNNTAPGYVDIINTANDTVGGSVQVGVGPTAIILDTYLNRLYVANTTSNTVTVLDATSIALGVNPPMTTLGTVSVGSSPVSVAALPNGLAFYVANSASNNVSVVSSNSLNVVNTVAVGNNPTFIATEPSSTKVYTANAGSGNISIIQTSNNTLVLNLPAPQQDPNCVPTVSTCPLQRPVMILTQ